jgi:DNA-directed RNA polymerase specialized sigma24 family protein
MSSAPPPGTAATGPGEAAGLPAEVTAQAGPPADALRAFAADTGLYGLLAEEGFAGPTYERLRAALAGYGYQFLRSRIRDGTIFAVCTRRRIRGLPPAPSWAGWTEEDIDDIVQETVVEALAAFRRAALAGTGWHPFGGASLATYFVGGCLFAFAATYRRHHADRRMRRAATVRLAAELQADPRRVPDVAESASDNVLAEARLRALPPRQRVIVLLAAAGYGNIEISDRLADGTSPRAVEGVLRRYRQRYAAPGEDRDDR